MGLVTQTDWLSIQIQIDETTEFVRKQQRMVQWLNDLGVELNDLPTAIAGLVDTEKQAAVDVIAGLLENAQQFAAACAQAADESRVSAGQMQGLTESFLSSLAESAAANRAEIAGWIAEIEQIVDSAEAAAAADVIDDTRLSRARAFSSAETDARYAAVAHSHAVADLPAELLTKSEADARYADDSHLHIAANITAGTFNAARLPRASSTAHGAIKVRVSGTTAYITTNGSNA